MSKYKVFCSNRCCPEIEFLSDGKLTIHDDYNGKITVDRITFELMVESHQIPGLNPEESLVFTDGIGEVRLLRREVLDLDEQYQLHRNEHPAPCSI